MGIDFESDVMRKKKIKIIKKKKKNRTKEMTKGRRRGRKRKSKISEHLCY